MAPLLKQKPTYDPVNVNLHAISREWGDPTQYGWSMPPPKGLYTAMCKAILTVCAGDGKVSQTEREFVLGRAKSYGAPDDELQEIATTDFAKLKLQDVIEGVPENVRGVVLYDAILTAKVDGFPEKERAVARQMAEAMGLEAGLVNAIECIQNVEASVRNSKIQLLLGNQNPPRGVL